MRAPLALGAVLLVLGFVPLLGGPRYEAALLAGLIAPAWVGVTVTRRTIRRLPSRSAEGAPLEAAPLLWLVVAGLGDAAQHLVLVLGVAALLGWVLGMCEPLLGFSLFVLGPGLGMVLAALWGTFLGCFGARLQGKLTLGVCCAAGVGAPLVSALWAVGRFYSTPTVYAYDQFAGYFAGPLYDTVDYDLLRLLSFRAGSLQLVLGVVVLSALFEVPGEQRGLRVRGGGLVAQIQRITLGVLCLGGYGLVTAHGEQLGHRGTAASIQDALGQELSEGPCRVFYSRGVERGAARHVARECVGHLRQHQRFFALARVEPVTVYLFADDREKRGLMGAGRTNIAKPWRREVYIKNDGFPHPILGHELAHVVTGAFGQGPFRVAGHVGGWLVDPGRVEGFAEGAALREDSFGTLEQWAAAMKRVQRLPPLGRLFQLGFFGESASRSYTAAGAFVQFIRDEFGPEVLKQWYQGRDLEELTDRRFSQLEAAWHKKLDATAVPAAVLATAQPRFSRPGLFARTCPHATDRKLSEFQTQCARSETRARRLLNEILKWDPNQQGLLLEAPRCVGMLGEPERAVRETQQLLAQVQVFEEQERRRAYEFLGDMAWRLGQDQPAQSHYQKARGITYEPDQLRQLDVKQWALGQSEEVQAPLRALFLPPPDISFSPGAQLFRWVNNGPEAALGRYLLARLAWSGQRYEEARFWLSGVLVDELPLPSVRFELARMRVVAASEAALMQGRTEELHRVWAEYLKLGPTWAERTHLERLVERCSHQ